MVSFGEPNLSSTEVASGPVRRWLIWLTLLAAAVVVVWALMSGADRELQSLSSLVPVVPGGLL